MKNPTFEKALSLLIHPYSLAMLALLLVNDHLLRRLWPSWWTGKLGDVAWLAFAPFALAALLAWILPLAEPARSRWTSHLSFLLVGGIFALAKTLPAAYTLVTNALQVTFGAPPTLVRDPSDLLALPILLISWRLWQTHQPAPFSHRRLASGLVALGFAALLTIANSAAPDYGITCLEARDGTVYAQAAHSAFSSTDGGLTWISGPSFPFDSDCVYYMIGSSSPDWRTIDIPSAGLSLRYRPGYAIEASSDAGQTWEGAFPVEYATPAQKAYLTKTRQGNPMVVTGPIHAIMDPTSGNVIFAMGHDGVLLRTAAGQWQWSAVGPYHRTSRIPDLNMLWVLFSDQLLLAIGAGLIVFSLAGLRFVSITRKWLYVILIIYVIGAVLAWLVVVLLFPPTLSSYGYILVSIGILTAAILLFPLALLVGVDLFRQHRAVLPRLLLIALAGAALYVLPSLLWAYNLLPTPAWVIGLSLLFVTAAVIFGFVKANVKSGT